MQQGWGWRRGTPRSRAGKVGPGPPGRRGLHSGLGPPHTLTPSSLVPGGPFSVLSPYSLVSTPQTSKPPPHFSDTSLPLPSPTYLTPQMLSPVSPSPLPSAHPVRIPLPLRRPGPLPLSARSPLPSQSYESAINTPAKDLEGVQARHPSPQAATPPSGFQRTPPASGHRGWGGERRVL